RKDGSRFWANVVLTPIYDTDGTLTGFARVTHDLTARLAAETVDREVIREQATRAAEELSEEEARAEYERHRALNEQLQVILEGVPDGVTVQDRSGKLLFANSSAARICGFKSARDLLAAPLEVMVWGFEIRDEQGKRVSVAQLPARRILAGEPAADA